MTHSNAAPEKDKYFSLNQTADCVVFFVLFFHGHNKLIQSSVSIAGIQLQCTVPLNYKHAAEILHGSLLFTVRRNHGNLHFLHCAQLTEARRQVDPDTHLQTNTGAEWQHDCRVTRTAGGKQGPK